MRRGLKRLGPGEWNIYGFVEGESSSDTRAFDRKRKNPGFGTMLEGAGRFSTRRGSEEIFVGG